MSSTNYEPGRPPFSEDGAEDATSVGRNDAARAGDSDKTPSLDSFYLSSCALVGEPSEWTRELEQLGVTVCRRPEALYNAMRSRGWLPRSCIVDLDSLPRNLVKSLDIRIPCPKVWIGKSASNPSDIKNFGIYYSRARADELNNVIGQLVETDRSTLLPSGIVSRQLLPLISVNEAYRDRLHHYAEMFGDSNLITLHGEDMLELQLVAQYLAVESQRARIWEVRSETSIQSTLRKIAQARRPGSDVTIVVFKEIDTGVARDFYKSIPAEYSMVKLSERSENPVDGLSFTLPKTSERPEDIENWVVWFVCRATIEYGIALSGLPELISSVSGMLSDSPFIEDIRSLCERSVKQHATMMEEHGEYVSYEDMVHNYERAILRKALFRNDWNLSATAKSLGLAESSLRYKLNKLGVVKNDSSL